MLDRLSRRQLECCRLAAEGLPDKTIGLRLGIADTTVNVHLKAAYLKLGITTRRDLPALFGLPVLPEPAAWTPKPATERSKAATGLNDLSHLERKILRMLFDDGLTIRQVAERLDHREGQIAGRYHRLRKTLGAADRDEFESLWREHQTQPALEFA